MSTWRVGRFVEHVKRYMDQKKDSSDQSRLLALGGNIYAVIDEEVQRLASELDGPAREYFTTSTEIEMSNSGDNRFGATGTLPTNFRRLIGASVLDETGKIVSDSERIVEWNEWLTLTSNPRSRGCNERPIFAVRRGGM